VEIEDFPWKREEAWMLTEAFFREKLGSGVEDPFVAERIQRIRTAFDLVWIDKSLSITVKAGDLESVAREASDATARVFRRHLYKLFLELAAREVRILELEQALAESEEL
jgi:hypothetical protein